MTKRLWTVLVAVGFCVTFFQAFSATASSTTMTLQSARDIFAAGNAFYKAQKYPEAAEAYREVLDGGYVSAPVLYNLGTTDARLGRRTLALAYLRRAKQLSPRDGDIQANLEFVTANMSKKRQPHTEEMTADSLWKRVYGWLTAEEWLLVTWFGLMAVAIGVSAQLLVKSGRYRHAARILAIVGAIAVVCLAVPTISQVYATRIQKDVIVITSTDMLSGPADRFTRVTSLEEGQIIRLLGHESGGYLRVETLDGMTGYVSQEDVVRI